MKMEDMIWWEGHFKAAEPFVLPVLHNASFSACFFQTLLFLSLSLSHNNYAAPPPSVFHFVFLNLTPSHTHAHTEHHTPYFITPCVSALSRDYNVVSHYTLWALCQCSRRPKLPKSSDFCHVGTAQLDNWRWKVQIFTLPPSLCFSRFNLFHPHTLLLLILAFKLKFSYWIYVKFSASSELWAF